MQFLSKRIFSRITTLVTNEYKFYVDFKGMLYFQDSKDYIYPNAIKDRKFITQLYQNLTPTADFVQKTNSQSPSADQDKAIEKMNNQLKQKRKLGYSYVAQFWGQKNFIKCGVAPIIYNRILKSHQLQAKQRIQTLDSLEYLEFSLGQYSIFRTNQLRLDGDGRLWHPYIKVKENKALKVKTQEKTQIWGVFGNQLISQMLDKITYEKDKTYLTYEGSKQEIARMD